MLVGVHAKVSLDAADIVGTVSGTVSLSVVLDLATDTDDSADVDESRLLCRSLGLEESLKDAFDVETTVGDFNNFPTASAHLGIDVFSVAEINATVTSNLVVVVNDDQVVQLPVASSLDSLESNTLLQAGIANHAPRRVVDELIAWAVVGGSQVLGGHGHTNGIGNTLTQGTSGNFNTLILNLGVTRADGVMSIRVIRLELVKSHILVSRKMQEGVLE